MKSFVKKVAALAIVFSMASSTLANAQEEDGKVSFSVQGDLVSSDSARCLQLCRFDDRRHEFPYVLRFVL